MTEILDRPLLPARHRLNVDAYYKMAAAGILGHDEHVELIEGEIIDMAPIGSPHSGRLNRLVQLFGRAAADGLVVLAVQNPLRLNEQNEPQPDLMLLRPRADFYTQSHPMVADVFLLAEVSGTSLVFDRSVKRSLYAKFGIPEYWIVDLDGKMLDVCRDPQGSDYESIKQLKTGKVCPLLVPAIMIDVETLFS